MMDEGMWSCASSLLLSSPSPHVRFMAANILHVKILREWRGRGEEGRKCVLDRLLEYLRKFGGAFEEGAGHSHGEERKRDRERERREREENM